MAGILGAVRAGECFRGWISASGDRVHGSKPLAGRAHGYHLHSTASTFCGGDDDEGLIPVSEEADDMEAPA